VAREVSSLQQLLKVVGQADRIELDYATSELLDATRVHITVDIIVAVKEVKAEHNLVSNVKDLLKGEVLLAERLPVGDGVRGLHLNEDQGVWHDPVLLDGHEVLVLKALERLDHLESAATFLLVKRGNIDARHHLVCSGGLVSNDENLAVAFAEVQGHYHVWVVEGVRRVSACSTTLASHH